eukprot:TRINITY_DN3275_c0_g1_i1.p1 TRINITY_DN3275_c0_g1~~TRINITY_DN3275_c0_g1_i1.p1  ORF type:complete len:384 (+),score=43.98 TRINITY_DN3275_c0_g1_i1:164-1315(+)
MAAGQPSSTGMWSDSFDVLIADPLVIPARKLNLTEYQTINAHPHSLHYRQLFVLIAFLPVLCVFGLSLLRSAGRQLGSLTARSGPTSPSVQSHPPQDACPPVREGSASRRSVVNADPRAAHATSVAVPPTVSGTATTTPKPSRNVQPTHDTPAEVVPVSMSLPSLAALVFRAATDALTPGTRAAAALRHLVSLFAILVLLNLTDHWHVLGVGPRVYSRDFFLFILLILMVGGLSWPMAPFVSRKSQSGLLNRDQTEEWKGWMQVVFVWYHLFAAGETYPLIRVLIAAYVWQTGFGNFSYFWITNDYSFVRVWKMLFRLNFLVVMLVFAMPRPYMLYYICPLHTLWFVATYAIMAIAPSVHRSPTGAAAKLLVACVCVGLLWPL